jgi:hypothetical protein
MSATVLVRDATVKTLAVSVQTLRLGPKRVTLAVFRQLLQENVVDAAGMFRGLVWGTVNYHPDGCASIPSISMLSGRKATSFGAPTSSAHGDPAAATSRKPRTPGSSVPSTHGGGRRLGLFLGVGKPRCCV